MKNKFLVLLICLLSIGKISFARNGPGQNFTLLSGDQIYLHTAKGNIKFFSIKQSNIVSLLGKPKRVKKLYSEIEETMVSTYIYNEAEISFDKDGDFDDFDIKSPLWGLVFKVNNKFSIPFTLNSDADRLKALLPHLDERNKNLVLWIKGSDGSISFSIVGNKIKGLGYFFDIS
ncbi:hypothetical protein [Mucilaginibacter jinjuensis]|uniref:Uncharacterized protein n=1 Tax=Mucilaginibacter jinjuensis TaxID=1176721 RepID=A0ABY7T7H6_9SPHI|nr:hypothetical protein [Mucilaginibacter jinjuensis]WCT12317.1 hypothetical protein PQO05_00010 [Mucilaginibacter jinjuensis]